MFESCLQRRLYSHQVLSAHVFKEASVRGIQKLFSNAGLLFFSSLEFAIQSVPVHPAGNVDVVHEALNVQRQVRRVGAHQLLQLLALLVQPQHSPRVLAHVELVLALELLAEVIGQDLVKIAAAEVRVKRSSEDLAGGAAAAGELRVTQAGDLASEEERAGGLTLSLPLLKAAMETWNDECPMSTNTTFLGLSSGVGRSCL